MPLGVQYPPRPLQPHTTNANNKLVSLTEEKNKYRKSLSKRLITRIKHLQNERETEVFIEEQLRTSREEEQTTEEVVRKIHQIFADGNFKYTELIKSGSLEKGTAIKGMADVDLVLYFPPTPSLACSPTESPISSPASTNHFNFDFRPTSANHCSLEKLRTKHEKVQIEMREILELNSEKIAHHFEIQNQNPYVDQLNFQSTPSAPEYQVDLTLAVDFDQPSPFRAHLPRDFVERVKRDAGNFFSSSFTREQNNYIRSQPERVKNLIRLVKFWYKTDVPDLTRLPPAECKFKSYLFELLTIGVWKQFLNDSEQFEMLRAFKTVLTAITQHESMYLVVGEQHPAPNINTERPLIVGPNNEYENVAKSGKNWKELSRIARLTMVEANLRYVLPYPCPVAS